jgi:hypothetical protein
MRIFIWLVIILSTLSFTRISFAQQSATQPTKINSISDSIGNPNPSIGFGQQLRVMVDGSAALNPTDYVLYLNGRPINELNNTEFDIGSHALVFRLLRTDANASVWSGLLGSPTGKTIPVTVALGTAVSPTLFGDGITNKFHLVVTSSWQLSVATVPIIAVIGFIWFGAKRTTLLKDNLLPQISVTQQPYSLGRCQMAFWFILVFASFVSLFVLFWDYHSIITPQSLWLMGISGLTGVSAIAVDVIKDSPADAANRALQALGLNTYADVTRTRSEIADRQSQLKAKPAPTPDIIAKLGLEIRDRQLLLRAYENTIKPFLSEGWFWDMTTDQNGMSLARLQTFCWTCTLGVVFLIEVYMNLTMPQFDTNLLYLMGISSLGYVGFKYPEPQQ